ncbi:HAD family hydrolase [Sphingomonas sp. NFR15]|uniref:HAD-IIIC family phosphatase n=1 Tax=Sphingomonas sp. NFR15 TaxID=1566282 RepID=UPI0008897863|nr:HAD-IIIC family phosphatase [Sphingomonas sp. NFR15]SDA28544.1 HAD-superfamily phosphatase, subfamily IIIC/FkbH-like domain-containing protein [Sphingomonas sp. NFR15]
MRTRLDWLLTSADIPYLTSDESLPDSALAEQVRQLAQYELGFSQIFKLDRRLRKIADPARYAGVLAPLRLAVLGASTLDHLLPALRAVGARHGFLIDCYLAPYGQYLREIADPASALHAFAPEVVLFALDATHLVGEQISDAPDAALDATMERLRAAWRGVIAGFGAQVIQQTVLPRMLPLMGSNEHALPGSPARMAAALNARLRTAATEEGIDLLAIDDAAVHDGLAAWHDPVLWLKGKQEISPAAAQHYADLALRPVLARRGRSAKCLVLDLDNTLWGGVIGDDGLGGIVLGQGSAEGEAYLSLQRYALDLMKRGVLLAVCSKNDDAVARAAFEQHPEMLLRLDHITSFVANWEDKPTNLRRIADEIGIGLDSLVFVDDNPFERNLVRSALPMVRVPELPEDAALYAGTLARAGYFEALAVTREDRERTALYAANAAREKTRASGLDITSYLESLDMVLEWQRFDAAGQQRIVQLVNKTNQFNLTTRRYTDAEIAALIADPNALALQFRLRDTFGDNGVIAIVIGHLTPGGELDLETWLMSCRVLGRGVETACLGVVAGEAKRLGATALLGRYVPTERNDMVREHYPRLGFVADGADHGETRWRFDLDRPLPDALNISVNDIRGSAT